MSSTYKERIAEFLTQLKNGAVLIERKNDGDKYPRRFFLHSHEQFLSYNQSDTTFGQPNRYFIDKIDEIRTGYHSRTFDRLVRHKMVEPCDEQCAFSLFYNNYRNELHLMADDESTRDVWVEALRYLIDSYSKKRQHHVIVETNWILNHFYTADKDGSGTLTKQECRNLLTDLLNANVSDNDFEKLFKDADKSGEGLLSADEFVGFFHALLHRKDLYRIMQKYVKDGDKQSIDKICMNIDELLYFLRNVQKQTIILDPPKDSKFKFSLQLISTKEQVKELIDQFEINDQLREQGLLSLSGFRNLMLSDDFSLMKPWCSRYIYQDMTRPLSDYYIKTSHNTYLFNNQITGDSNPEAYNRALRAGCRAVEIDCYDGDNGRPIVKHGYTLIKPCLFESIIRFMEHNLFKTSPYPVILNLENHCSLEQQNEMARILYNVFGDRLITEPLSVDDPSVLPSPEDLKYKVLLRGVKKPASTILPKSIEPGEVDDDNKVVEHNLADLFVYFQNTPFRAYKDAKDTLLCYQSSSLAEKNFDKAARTDPIGLIKIAKKSSLRTYPDGLRQDSSNPNPIHPWNFGIQMVALNYQNDDPSMSLAYGKFLDNGGCGYVLKPKYLNDIHETNFNPFDYSTPPKTLPDNVVEFPQRLIITVISGQFIPRSNETTNDIPDPYVVISTHGIGCDQQSRRTKYIENNGFDPLWNETFEFDIHFPQMCLIRFDVYDYDRFTKDDRLLYFCLPMTTIQTGYRHVHLRAQNNNLTYSTLFIHVEIKSI